MLTSLQLQHFRTFGFVVLRDIFQTDEVDILRNEYEEELERVYAHDPFTGEKRHWTMMLDSHTPLFRSLLEDERFCSVAEQLYGDDVIGVGTDANRYVGDTVWHSDHRADPAQDVHGVKFAFYLDSVDDSSGALRLIPGSQNRSFHDQLRNSMKELDLSVAEVPAYACISSPGDVVAFDMRCWHASSGGAQGRRMCTCVFYNNPRGRVEEEAARLLAIKAQGTPAKFGREGQPLYPQGWLSNPDNNPKRQSWLNRMAELGYFELPVGSGI